MLQTLTETALARRWAPPLFARLCSQLQDTREVKQEEIDWLLEAVVVDGVPNPALLEYILTVALDPKSVLPLETLLVQWAGQSPDTRAEKDKVLMVYVSRGIGQFRVTPDRVARICEALDTILGQAIDSCSECLFLLQEMSRHGLLRRVADLNRDWRLRSEAKVRSHAAPAIAGFYSFDPLEVASGDGPKVDTISYTPSKTFRLLWLDMMISHLQHLGSAVFLQQLDILWPNERTATLIYELTLTVFDGCAVFAGSEQAGAVGGLWTAFLHKRLPLVLQDLLARDDGDATADGALSRVLTTMDKKVAEVVDASDLRASFIRTCIDLGLCDSAVLHVLHKNHPARPENATAVFDGTTKIDDIVRVTLSQDFEKVTWETSIAVRLVHEFAGYGPRRQKAVAVQILKLLLKPSTLSTRRHVALLCAALMVYPSACDQLLLHVQLRVVIDVLLAHLDQARSSPVTQTVGYGDLGGIFAFLRFLFARYQLDKQLLAESRSGSSYRSSWARTFLLKMPGEYPTSADLSESQSQLLGQWIAGLFGGRGIGENALQPFSEVLTILPALTVQVSNALQIGLLSPESMTAGTEYFVQAGFAPLLVTVFDQLVQDLWLQRNLVGTLQTVCAFLGLLQREHARPAVKAVGAVILPKIAAALAWPTVSANPDPGVAPLAQTAASLVQSVSPLPDSVPDLSGSLSTNLAATVSALQRWQERSVGLPTINRRVFMRAISVLGPHETRALIESELKGGGASATEIEVSLLVVYGSIEFGQSPNRDLLDAAGREIVTQVARDYAQRFKAVFDIARQEEEALVTQHGGGSPGVSVQEYAASHPGLDTAPEPADIPLDPMEGDFSYGFDLDTGPMDLDELDSAMNFTDLLE